MINNIIKKLFMGGRNDVNEEEWKNYSVKKGLPDLQRIKQTGPPYNAFEDPIDAETNMINNTVNDEIILDPAITFTSYVNDLIGYIFNKKLIEEDVSYHNVNYKLFITCIVVIVICYLIFVLVVGTMLYKNNYPAGKSKELRKKMIDEEYSLWILEYWYDFGYINESNFSILKISIFVYILFILYGYYLTGVMKDKLLPSVIGIVILLIYLVYIMPYNNENYI